MVKRPFLRDISLQDVDLQKLRVYKRIPLRLSINAHPWESLRAHSAKHMPYSEGDCHR